MIKPNGKKQFKILVYEPIRKQNPLLWVEMSVCAGKVTLFERKNHQEPGGEIWGTWDDAFTQNAS